MTAENLYQALIVEHARSPRHAVLPSQAVSRRGDNPLCGDRVEVGVVIAEDVVTEVGAVARACALCIASGSMMTVAARGESVGNIRALASRFAAALDGDDHPLGDLDAFRGVRAYPSRKRCALLPWETLLGAIETVGSGAAP